MGTVKPFCMKKDQARRLISKLAVDSSNVTFVNECANGDWETAVNYRQMLLCLRQGEVLSDPRWDEVSKTHRCRMSRFHAGQDIVLEVAIEDQRRLYVINIC